MSRAEQSRLTNAATFFAQKMLKCQSLDVVHLLYLLDFEHYRRTGASVTGLQYFADQHGPTADVPWSQIADRVKQPTEYVFNDEDFTPYQLQLMAELAAAYQRQGPHQDVLRKAVNGAYSRARSSSMGKSAPIPYEWAIADDDPHAEIVRRLAVQRSGIVRRAQNR